MTLHLVRHGRPIAEPGRPAASWELDPAGYDDVWALRESGRLPRRAAWFCSPAPRAQQTAQLLTDASVGIVDDLREQERGADWVDDFTATLGRAFADPASAAHAGWEPLAATRDRLLPAVRRILDVHGGDDVVLVGHGTAWTLLAAELTGVPADLERWASLAMPDVLALDPSPGAR